MLHDPAFWVALALVVFIALVFKPIDDQTELTFTR